MIAETEIGAAAATARLTVGRINAGMESRMVPMVGQILRIIRDISGKSERMSVGDLVEFIDGEPTIMGRILTIAGSVGYNAAGMEINSIHQAVSLIGFERVRTLAISILLLESAHAESATALNRELAGTALIGGLVTAETCRRGVSSEPELGFICGALRNYGRMLAATFLPLEYAESVRPPLQEGAEASFLSTFGLTPMELGRQIMTHLQLPNPILNTLVSLSPQDRRYCSATATSALTGAADFGLRLAELLQTPGLDHHNVERRIEALSREYDVDFYFSRDDVRELLLHLVGVLECFRSRAGSYVGSVSTFQRLQCLAAARALPPAFDAAVKSAGPVLRPPPVIASADSYEI
ncbi:MAG: HDOD domain-containing protein [Verrucomicrobiota bacterium]